MLLFGLLIPAVGFAQTYSVDWYKVSGEGGTIYPVSDLVNSSKTDDARCIEPVRIDRDFFERQWWGDEGKG